MSSYGRAALNAVDLYRRGRAASPRDAWEQATVAIFGKGTPSQEKGCPRDTFLGLCGEGLIEGVPPGVYTRSEKNKQYALDAVHLLRKRPDLARDPLLLWEGVQKGTIKAHNSQMDIVVALWEKKLIARK